LECKFRDNLGFYKLEQRLFYGIPKEFLGSWRFSLEREWRGLNLKFVDPSRQVSKKWLFIIILNKNDCKITS